MAWLDKNKNTKMKIELTQYEIIELKQLFKMSYYSGIFTDKFSINLSDSEFSKEQKRILDKFVNQVVYGRHW